MTEAQSLDAFSVIEPSTGRHVRDVPGMSEAETAEAIDLADAAFRDWRRVNFADRAKRMKEAADVLRRRVDELAHLMTEEMGKTRHEGRDEVEKCAKACEFYASSAEKFLTPETVEIDGTSKAFVTYNPLGVVLAIMPWNFPFWQAFRFIAPGLMAGNGGVLKHASNVPGAAMAIEDVLREAGFPEHLFRTLLVSSKAITPLIHNSKIAAVTLTGSVGAGRAVAAEAGKALKKCVLELGGSDAYIVLEDADIELAAKTCAAGRLVNNGQSCIAAKRFVVVEAVRDAFEKAFVKEMAACQCGDPYDEDTTLGPMARLDLRDELHEQVERSVAKGARVLLGGKVPEKQGAWYPATVLTDVAAGMPAYEEELFGPVASVITVRNEADALDVANGTEFGLGSAVFTQDLTRGERIAAQELEAGSAFVNLNVRSDPRLPFGGVKSSGYGRELSHFGIREFVNVKSVAIR